MSTPAMQTEQVVSTLNSLIEINRDGQKDFQRPPRKSRHRRSRNSALSRAVPARALSVICNRRCDPWAAIRKIRAALQAQRIASGWI
jgi:hypothetical protein